MPSRTSVFSSQCSVIAKSTRQGDTNTQHAQFSALFRVIPRPSFPAEPDVPTPWEGEAPAEPDVSVQFSVFSNRKIHSAGHHHTTRLIFRVIPRHSAAIISRQGGRPHPSGGRGSRRAGRQCSVLSVQ